MDLDLDLPIGSPPRPTHDAVAGLVDAPLDALEEVTLSAVPSVRQEVEHERGEDGDEHHLQGKRRKAQIFIIELENA